MLPTGGLNLELIDREDGLGPVIDSWRSLATARGNAFVTPEWYLAALRTLHAGSAPAVVVARDRDGKVRGLLPFVDARTRMGRRWASFPGTRYGDIYHPVAAREDEEPIAAAAAPLLAERFGGRCRLELGRVDADAGWWRELARAWPAQLSAVPHPAEALPYIELNGSSWEEYLAGRSRQFRNQVGRKMRWLRRDHEVRIRQSGSGEEALGDVGTLFALHDARWTGRDVVSSIADPKAREFHRRFVTEAQRRGWLRLYLLEVDSAPVAGWYGWRVGDRFSYYQAGFDPAWGRYSVGFLLLAETVRGAISEGAAEYDLLLGDEPFKSRFATGKRLGRSVLLAPRLSRPRLRASARAWVARRRAARGENSGGGPEASAS
jgi:CelD/BcsL family acetyltransferase involved in cellulose biosynthesis